jgi:hypothetical protein
MKKIKLVLAFIIIFYGLNAQDIEYAKQIIARLSDASMHGRGYVNNGINKAAKYIEKEFKRNGIGDSGGIFSQWLTVSVNTFPGQAKLQINKTTLNPGVDFLIDPESSGIRGKFNLIVITPGDIVSGASISKIKKTTPHDMLLLEFSGADTLNDLQKIIISKFRLELKHADRYNAAGVIEIISGKLVWNISSQCGQKPWIITNKAFKPCNENTAVINIRNRYLEEKSTRNIIGYFKGKMKPDSFVVFTAHYDHLGLMGQSTYFPGANDNASGIALMLSLMKYFADHPFDYSLLFIATSAEELGLVGSTYYTQYPLFDLKRIKFLINFDLAGTGDEGITVVNASVYRNTFQKLVQINNTEKLLPDIKSRGEACNSDHCPFYRQGVPCFYMYTLGGSKAYHDIYDTADTLSLAVFENYVKLIIKFMEEL